MEGHRVDRVDVVVLPVAFECEVLLLQVRERERGSERERERVMKVRKTMVPHFADRVLYVLYCNASLN